MDIPQRSISFRELRWDEVDCFARENGFRDRSPFIEYCTSKEMYKKKFDKVERIISTLGMLLGFAIVIFLIIMLR